MNGIIILKKNLCIEKLHNKLKAPLDSATPFHHNIKTKYATHHSGSQMFMLHKQGRMARNLRTSFQSLQTKCLSTSQILNATRTGRRGFTVCTSEQFTSPTPPAVPVRLRVYNGVTSHINSVLFDKSKGERFGMEDAICPGSDGFLQEWRHNGQHEAQWKGDVFDLAPVIPLPHVSARHVRRGSRLKRPIQWYKGRTGCGPARESLAECILRPRASMTSSLSQSSLARSSTWFKTVNVKKRNNKEATDTQVE